MEPELHTETEAQELLESQEVTSPSRLHTVTPLSKYLAMLLFVVLPFVGGWIGYHYAPVKIDKLEVNERVGKETVEIVEKNQGAYLEPMVCDNFVGEFCSLTLEIDGVKKDCVLGVNENGMTISYQTQESLLSHCRDVVVEKYNMESDSVPSSEEVKIIKCNPKDKSLEWSESKDCVSDMTDIDTERENRAITIINKSRSEPDSNEFIKISHDRYQVMVSKGVYGDDSYTIVDIVDNNIKGIINIAPGWGIKHSSTEMIFLSRNSDKNQVVKLYVFGEGRIVTLKDSELRAPLTYHPGSSKMIFYSPRIVSSSTDSITLAVYNEEKEAPVTVFSDGTHGTNYEQVGEKILKLQ